MKLPLLPFPCPLGKQLPGPEGIFPPEALIGVLILSATTRPPVEPNTISAEIVPAEVTVYDPSAFFVRPAVPFCVILVDGVSIERGV